MKYVSKTTDPIQWEKVNTYRRNWYHGKNNKKIKVKILENRKTRVSLKREWINKHKEKHGCIKCGFSNPLCLDFHHIDQNSKYMSISKMSHLTFSNKKILKEIGKCVILCANCHRLEHRKKVSI